MKKANWTSSSGLTLVLASLVLTPFPAHADSSADILLSEFADPPQPARPRVWWHWMNGNVTEEGIAKDIDWMRRIGIGGLQNFDASLATPVIVDRRLVYMTPEWRKAFRFAAEKADAAGLELAIAGSPGWSETGGPWVPAEDGIKKVTWSVTEISGGKRFRGPLAPPPSTPGPFPGLSEQTNILENQLATVPHAYNDIGVFAIPLRKGSPTPPPAIRRADGEAGDFSLLGDGDLTKAVELGTGTSDNPPAILFSYPRPARIRSAVLHMQDIATIGGSQRFLPRLEARVGADWITLASFELSSVPTTVSFAPVRASEFRLVFGPYTGPSGPPLGPGTPGAVVPPIFGSPAGPAPVKVTELRLFDESMIDRFETKAAFSLSNDYFELPTTASPLEKGVAPERIVNLTDRLRSDGTIDWAAPPGRWQIVRLGWSLTGKTNHPAPAEATGLEVDKLDGAAVERYLRQYLDSYRSAAGLELMGNNGIRALLTDSTEVGAFNWTPRMIEQFKRLRGYDPTLWLPALTGMIVKTRADSDRFLFDFRRTLAELHASEHYATVARVAHEYGLTLYGEALEDRRPVIGDDMALRRYTDIPMAALWTWTDAAGVRPTLLGDMKGASSVGHFYGKPVIAAESMTSVLAPWAHSPSELRRTIDLEFAHGINRPVIHTSVHQPLDDKKPGLSLMIFGQFFNRHDTWAEMAKPWVDYIARSSYLLQQGSNVADVAYFYGEEAPLTAITAYGALQDTPHRYAYDFVNADGLLNDLKVTKDGKLQAPSGAIYESLYLGGRSQHLTLAALKRIEAFADAGATIVGKRPGTSPSLSDDSGEVGALISKLWDLAGDHSIRTGAIEDALTAKQIIPDVDYGDAEPDNLMFVHRRLPAGDLYFLINRSKDPVSFAAKFRVTGRAPQFLQAVDGTVRPATYRQVGDQTEVPIELRGYDSTFVLFRAPTLERQQIVPVPTLDVVSDLSDDWRVAFQKERGAPAGVTLPTLVSLSDNADPGIRYFSGEATYTRSFRLPATVKAGDRLWLDLGQVGDLAEVTVNGVKVGTPWSAPFRVKIGRAVHPGANTLQVKVANRWINRLIGDAQPGAKKVAFVTIPTYRPDAALRPSGLIGPVRLLSESR